LFASVVILAIVTNFLLSSVILVFTAGGLVAGAGNLGGSVIFGIYLELYRRKRGIGSPEWVWITYRRTVCFRLFWLIPVRFTIPIFGHPGIRVPETNPIQQGWLWR